MNSSKLCGRSCATPGRDSSSADKIEFSSLPIPTSADNIKFSVSIPRVVDIEAGTIQELKKTVPGMWQYPTNRNLCCIYRVPNRVRSVNPEAYTPQLVLIGPLHRSLKSQALKSCGDITNAKSMGYLNTEAQKEIYLEEFESDGTNIDDLRRMIKEDEERIRASYSESTTWIQSPEFVEMILLDSIFIFHLVLSKFSTGRRKKTGDPLLDDPCLAVTIKRDLMLLENQLPYFILEKLAEPIDLTPLWFRESVIEYFGFEDEVIDSKFSHFTDLFRCVSVETLPNHIVEKSCSPILRKFWRRIPKKFKKLWRRIPNKLKKFWRRIPKKFKKFWRRIPKKLGLTSKQMEKETEFELLGHMYNTDKLNSGGVEFSLNKEAVGKELSMYVIFENGCLKMPRLTVDDELEMRLRNVMALEQCHYPFSAHVCNHFIFLDYLIDTDKDVDLLVEKGIIQNEIGQHGSVAEMVNKLCLGLVDNGSYYFEIAVKVNDYYKNPVNRSRAILKSVYFGNLWTGTATVAAVFLLLKDVVAFLSGWFFRFYKLDPSSYASK